MNPTDIGVEIENAFPLVSMPENSDLSFHSKGCHDCDEIREDLEYYRDKEISGEVIRLVQRYLSTLSAKATCWILPHYLRFCLTPEAEYNRMETEFLIYALGPTEEFQEETLNRLSLLNQIQILCLIHFLEWCFNQEYWKDYCPEELDRGIRLLRSALDSR